MVRVLELVMLRMLELLMLLLELLLPAELAVMVATALPGHRRRQGRLWWVPCIGGGVVGVVVVG